ncbi:MAG: hypothetical protein ACP5RI_00320 [Candidatus Micrarchaeia archaeon]
MFANKKNNIKKNEKFTPNRFIKIIVIIFLILGIIILGTVYYIASMFKTAGIVPTPSIPKYISFTANLKSQDLLSSFYGSYIVPYILINYSASNITSLNITARLISSKPPDHIYILNWSGECINCNKNNAFVENLSASLISMNIINSSNPIRIIPESDLSILNSSDYLFILNGQMPQYLFNQTPSGISLLEQVLDNGATVIYVGSNFSKTLIAQSVLVPAQNIPSFLSTTSYSGHSIYNQSLPFILSPGKLLNDMSYTQVGNGYIFVFPNYLNTFPNMSDAANFFSLFMYNNSWIPNIATTSRNLTLNYSSNEGGNIGLLFNSTHLVNSGYTISQLNSSYVEAYILQSSYGPYFLKRYLFKPYFTAPNGTIDMPLYASPGFPISSQITIFEKYSTFVEPHFDIYTLDMQKISSIPPIFAKNISGSFTFYENFTPEISKGFYIVQLNGYSGQHYASGLLSVPPLSVSYLIGNYTEGKFLFFATAGGKPISNVNAIITLNGNYSENVTINNGTLLYTLPAGASIQQGNETFKIVSLQQSIAIKQYYKPAFVSINQQYIEFVIALIIVILEVTLVKTPFRDEFYIDISSLPEPQKTPIKIRENELINVFNSLNNYYHWRYMPLSKFEFKNAIATNIRVNSIPVNLTYENVEFLLDSLVKKGDVVVADDLYAPSTWITQSKHDIEYLATFKKLRSYLIAHGYIFTDLDKSDVADIITTIHNEKSYIVIYSKTSRFISKLPIQEKFKTYLVFLNDDKLEIFRNNLYSSVSNEAEILRTYISANKVILVSADNLDAYL